MHELWFWPVHVLSVSPAGIRETLLTENMSNIMEARHA